MRRLFTRSFKASLAIIAALLPVANAVAQAPDSWTRKADLSGNMTAGPAARGNSFSFSIGTKGYMGGGNDANLRSDFWEYDPVSDVWTQKASIATIGAVGFSIGNFGYAGAGTTNSFYRYDPSANAWAPMANVGGSTVRTGAYCFRLGARGYIGSGKNGSIALNDLWEYDPGSNTWAQKAGTPAGLDWYAAMAIGIKAYLIARDSALGTSVASVKEYDPITNTWTSKGAFPSGARFGASTFSFGNTGFLCAGSDGTGGYSDLWQYYPGVDAWIQRPSLPNSASRSTAASFSIDAKGYVCSGQSSPNSFLGDCYAYDTVTQTWATLSGAMGIARTGGAAFSINGKGYMGTGSSTSLFTGGQKDFWMYDPGTNVWTQRADFGGAARISAVGMAIGDKGYIGAGESVNGYEQDFWEYDPATNSWTPRASIPATATGPVSGFVAGNKGYLGINLSGSGSALYQFNPQSNAWTQKTAPPAGVQMLCFGIGRKGYAYGSGFWEYDADKDLWRAKAVPVSAMGIGFSIGGRGYLCGTKLQEYDPESDTWKTLHNYFLGPQYIGPSIAFGIGNFGYVGGSTNTFPSVIQNDFWQYTPSGIITAEAGVPICANDTLPFLVPYFTREIFNPGNLFGAELSDSTGSFANPIALTPLPGSAPGQLILRLPPSVRPNDHYKVRVVATDPMMVGSSSPLIFTRPHPKLFVDVNGVLNVDPGYQSYQWYKDTLFVFGATGTSYSPTTNGVYRVAVRDWNGCRGFSDSVVIRGLAVTTQSQQPLACYPNPVRDVLHFGAQGYHDASLYRTDGRLCIQQQHVQELDMHALPAGIYFLRLQDVASGKSGFVRIVKAE